MPTDNRTPKSPPVQAIETKYKGYRFRSRLEARWAVVFDALGLEWEYEPEGFELSCGRYLPDFYIRTWGIYAEIKPPQALVSDCDKMDAFFSEKAPLLSLWGTPGQHFAALGSDWSHGEFHFPRMAEVELSRHRGKPVLVMTDQEGQFIHNETGKPLSCLMYRYTFSGCEKEMRDGTLARFEFGESGVR